MSTRVQSLRNYEQVVDGQDYAPFEVKVLSVSTISVDLAAAIFAGNVQATIMQTTDFPPGGGTGNGDMLAANNLSELTDVSAARDTLGLGTSAIEDTSAFEPSGSVAAAAAQLTITVQEEGVSLASSAKVLNFVGPNVTVTGIGDTKTITVIGDGAGDALVANPLSQFAATTSAQLRSVLTDETGTGAAVFATSPTIASPTLSGIVTVDGAQVATASAMGALVIDVTKALNTKSISVDSTFTFSGAPAVPNTFFVARIKNTDSANPHTLTFPSVFRDLTQTTAAHTMVVPANGEVFVGFGYDGTRYVMYGGLGLQNNYTATAAPTVNDDVIQGYGAGSLWYYATAKATYICESAGTGAAVWTAISAIDGSITLAKMANLAQDQFIGRVTGSTGVPETATITPAARTVLDDTTVSAMRTTLGTASLSQTEAGFSFAIDTVSNQDYTIILRAPHGGTITETSSKCTSGTATATFKIGTTPLGGTANAVSSAQVNQAQASANVFAAGDAIVVTMSANSACLGAVFSVKYTRTLQ